MYYISTGELSKMYTLRQSFTKMEDYKDGRGLVPVVVDMYCCNLSTDEATAERKAAVITGQSVESLVGNLEAIRRRKAEDIAALELGQEEEEAARLNTIYDEVTKKVNAGVWPFGKWSGFKFLDVPLDYTLYMVFNHLDPVKHAKLIAAITAALPKEVAAHAKLESLKAGNGKHYGELAQRFKEVQVIVLSKSGFDGYYGWVDVTSYATDTGEVLLHMGTRKPCEVGERILLTATVKEHGEYMGVTQTKINRPLHKGTW